MFHRLGHCCGRWRWPVSALCQLSAAVAQSMKHWPNLWNSPLTATNTYSLRRFQLPDLQYIWVESCQNRYSGSGLFNLIQIHIKGIATLESLISVPLVIRVPQPHGGVKIVFYDFLNEWKLWKMDSLLHFSIWVYCSTSNSWIMANSTAKKVRTAWNFG